MAKRDLGVAPDYLDRHFGPGVGFDGKANEAQKAANRRAMWMLARKHDAMMRKRPLKPPGK